MSSELPKIGLMLNPAGVPPGDILTLAREADEAGLYAVGVGDASYDTFALLSAIAAVTRRLRLISAVATWTRTPVTTARAARTLDLVSGQRYILGLGTMPASMNENLHGIPYQAPLERMREYIQLVRMLWEATPRSPVDYKGRFYRVSGYRPPEPPPRPRLPILVGATRRNMIRLAGACADGVVFNFTHSVSWLRQVGVPSLAEGARQAQRPLEEMQRGVVLFAMATKEADAARAAARRTLAGYLSIPYAQDWLRSAGFAEEADAIAAGQAAGDRKRLVEAVTDRVVDATTVIGGLEQCRQRLADYSSLVDWVLLAPPQALPPAEQVTAIRDVIQGFAAPARG